MTCLVDYCDNRIHAAGLCNRHYRRRLTGKPMDVPCSVPGCSAFVVIRRLCAKHRDDPAPKPTCSVPDCGKPADRRGWCSTHYYRMYERGTLDLTRITNVEERFWRKVVKTETCWLWVGGKDRRGYGNFQITRRSTDGSRAGKSMKAHRYAYTLLIGAIPEGHQLDHTCEVKNCVNPKHLDPVTREEHSRRTSARQTHCKRGGHPLSGENVRITHIGARECRECTRNRHRERRAKLKRAREEANGN